jgi:hypothetical protein
MSLLKSLNPWELVPPVFSSNSSDRKRNLRSLSSSPNRRIGWPLDRKRRIHSSLDILNVSLAMAASGSGISAVVEGEARRWSDAFRALSA